MFGRALLPLVRRPKAIALWALCVTVCMSPIAIEMLFDTGLVPTEKAVTTILLAAGPLGLLGCACGSAISLAAMCSFAWAAPRFRQRLRGEFMATGVVLALAASLLAMLAFRPAPALFPFVLFTAAAAFAAGGAFIAVPELSHLAFLPALLAFTPWLRWGEAAVERPLAFSAVAAAIAAVAVGATFSTRTFRWRAMPEFSSPIVAHAKSWLATRRRRKHGPSPLATAARPDAHAPARLPYADTIVGRMIAMSRATGPVAWLLLLLAGPLTGSVFAGVLRIVGPDRGLQFLVGGMAVGILGFFHVLPPSQMLRDALPWSRRDHLVSTWAWHTAMATWYAMVAGLSSVLAVRALGSTRWTTVDAALMIGSTLLLFPVGWRVLHRWFGRPNIVILASAQLLLLYQLGTPAVAALLAALVPEPPLRLAALSLLVLSSQLLHWFLLKCDFAARDLVGGSI